ncbi:hypothetical protein HDU96_008228 [Phlyctochytrium bullatum]|nr:hypothetical protein HDU96_008228 [Phlyctochytrium bullatum]
MKSSSTIAAVAATIFILSTSTSAIESPQPSQNRTLQLVTVTGSASTYNQCSFYRDAANLQCSGKFLPYNPPDGPTSGKCITASASYGDLCIQAVDRNETLPFKYAFNYPEADVDGTITNDDDFEGEDDINELDDGLTERAVDNALKADSSSVDGSKVFYVKQTVHEGGCKTPTDAANKLCEANFVKDKLEQCKEIVAGKNDRCKKATNKGKKSFGFNMCFPREMCELNGRVGQSSRPNAKPCNKFSVVARQVVELCNFFHKDNKNFLRVCRKLLHGEATRCVKDVNSNRVYTYSFPVWSLKKS